MPSTYQNNLKASILTNFFLTVLAVTLLTACSNPQPGPDKTLAGTVLGAGWGAGAGAVIGNQVSASGEGVAVGAGFGAIAGAMSGAGYDLSEGAQLNQERQLASLKVQSAANRRDLEQVQGRLDDAALSDFSGSIYQVFFDEDSTSLRAGSVANLEAIADSLISNPRAFSIYVDGHTDDTGSVEHNERLAEARARTVSSYLGSRGLSMGQIKVTNHGAKRPIASNATPVGRQLNRRVDVHIGR